MKEFKKTPSVVSKDPPRNDHQKKKQCDVKYIRCHPVGSSSLAQTRTFLGFVGEFVAHHVYGDESQQRRGEGDEEAQILAHRLLDVSNAQKHNSRIQVHQPVEPECNKTNLIKPIFTLLHREHFRVTQWK